MLPNDFWLVRWDGSHLLRHAKDKIGRGYLRFLAFYVPNAFLVSKVGWKPFAKACKKIKWGGSM
jgi:hypothetical protein